MPRLTDPSYLAFPLRIEAGGPKTVRRALHVRQQIEQVLFTSPGERVFRHDFGAGVKRLVFEPFGDTLREITRKRLSSALGEVLHGEVDPKTLDIDVTPAAGAQAIEGEQRLLIAIAYRLATINGEESHAIAVGPDSPHG